jgi:23S rRNA pseudouridine1911/1915/1917 synthase
VSREYYALVWGAPNLSGTIDAPIARNPRDRLKMCVSRSMFAKPAVTHFRRLATGMLEKFPVSLVLCKLETGRTHQIRVHAASRFRTGWRPFIRQITSGAFLSASGFARQTTGSDSS